MKVLQKVKKSKLKIGDHVRIKVFKDTFTKGYEIRWSPEVYKIINIKDSTPTMFKVADLEGKEVKPKYYEEELQKTQFTENANVKVYTAAERKRTIAALKKKAEVAEEKYQKVKK